MLSANVLSLIVFVFTLLPIISTNIRRKRGLSGGVEHHLQPFSPISSPKSVVNQPHFAHLWALCDKCGQGISTYVGRNVEKEGLQGLQGLQLE